jgi:hypothetical protein
MSVGPRKDDNILSRLLVKLLDFLVELLLVVDEEVVVDVAAGFAGTEAESVGTEAEFVGTVADPLGVAADCLWIGLALRKLLAARVAGLGIVDS